MVPGPSRSQIACSAAGSSVGGEPVGQLGEPDPGLRCLVFGPFVAVDPDLDRPRTVGADLDEGRPEVGVVEVEVVDGDSAVLLVEGKLRRPGWVGVALAGDEHPLRFLRDADGGDLRMPLPGGSNPGSGASRRCCGRKTSTAPPGCGWRRRTRRLTGGTCRRSAAGTPVMGPGTRGAAGTARPARRPGAGRGSRAGRPDPDSPGRACTCPSSTSLTVTGLTRNQTCRHHEPPQPALPRSEHALTAPTTGGRKPSTSAVSGEARLDSLVCSTSWWWRRLRRVPVVLGGWARVENAAVRAKAGRDG